MESFCKRIHFLKETVTKMKTIKRKIRKFIYSRVPGFAGSFPYFGIKVYFPRNSIIFYMACEQGVYEHTILNLIFSFLKPNTFYFDIGSNIGLMSIPILATKADCKVVSFEPSPNTIPCLLKTHAESYYGDRWIIVDRAASDLSGETEFHLYSSKMGAFDGIRDTGRFNLNNTVNVPVTTIDDVWQSLGGPPVSVIKIDVEGAERLVLKGAQKCISSSRPFIFLEWNIHNMSAYNYKPEDILVIARDMQYQVLTVPDLIPVTNVGILRVHMCMTENFFLAPI